MTTHDSMAPGFIVMHGNRLEDLGRKLVEFLKAQPLPPLVPEVILVHSNGMKNWLEMALADDAAMGICAATSVEQPGSFLWQVYRQVLGTALPRQMPFEKNSLAWRLVRLLPRLAAVHPVYAPLQRYLAGGTDGRKLYQLATQLAAVFDGYQDYRADWLDQWAAGDDGQLGDQSWQPHLWRAIRADVGAALADSSRASVQRRFIAQLKAQVADGTAAAGLPQRVIVFGITALSAQAVEALAVLGQACQVLMLAQDPCRHHWGDLAGGHPLLASWGRQGRDYLHLVAGFDHADSHDDAFCDPVEAGTAPSQLAQLQSAILNLQPQPEIAVALEAGDDSISLVTTHSAQREVEVLHDRLLAWFDADAALTPRDVIVLVPDMETFAPHIHAVFGRFAAGKSRHIPYALADTTARQSPLVRALAQLLSLPDARVTLAEWLRLFEVAAVRLRFGVSEADVEQLQRWLGVAGVRWGLDAAHRLAWGVPSSVADRDQNTWAFGLRRLLLGYAVGHDQSWGGTLPQPGIGGLDAALVGRLLDWLDATSLTLHELSQAHAPNGWHRTMGAIVDRFFVGVDDAEERLIEAVLAPLDEWLRLCDEANLDAELPLDVVRDHWLAQIEQPGLKQRFAGRGVQFAGLMAMRAIPFKVVCLLGMNDGDYPRQAAPCDFDLMAHDWRAGDRSRREDDRYLFLETILAARQKLYISWQGHRATDNAERPPSVLVAQLTDYLAAGWTPPRTPQQHPLQPFSKAYFTLKSGFATYDKDWAALYEKEKAAGGPAAPQQARPLPTELSLEQLQLLVRQPVEVFFRNRLGITLDKVGDPADEDEPFLLDGLEKYKIGDLLLEAPDAAAAIANLSLSGRLPMAGFGAREAAGFQDALAEVLERRAPWTQEHPCSVPAQPIALAVGGIAITGTLTGLLSRAAGSGLLQLSQRLGAVTAGKGEDLAARGHIVASLWVAHLAGCASGMPLTSVQLGLDKQLVFDALEKQQAMEILTRLVNAYLAAWLRPLPVACKTAWAFLQAQRKAERKPGKESADPHEAAEAAFEGGRFTGDLDASPYLARAFDSYEDIADEMPAWAEQLYGDMARHIRVGQHEREVP